MLAVGNKRRYLGRHNGGEDGVQLRAIILFCCALGSSGSCRYGELPGTMLESFDGRLTWQPYDPDCQLQELLPFYLGPTDPLDTSQVATADERKPMTMLFLGDSVDRFTVWDMNSSALGRSANAGVKMLIREHWRAAIKLPNLEMIYHFTPGSHSIGPYHDDVLWNKTITNALPRGSLLCVDCFPNENGMDALELHQLLTGYEDPSVFVFSNILWDLGRWLFLSEIAEPERMEHFGKPLLREQEYLPQALLEEFRLDTEIQMQRIEKMVSKDTLLIYHNAAFAQLLNGSHGTEHALKGTGRRTHIVQLNAMTRRIVSSKPRWHLVDFGAMSETFLSGAHLRDEHHPNKEFILQVVNIYLNLYHDHGSKAKRKGQHPTGDVERWDWEYQEHLDDIQAEYAREAEAEEARYHLRIEAEKIRMQETEELKHKPRLHRGFKMLFNMTIGGR